MNNKLVDKFQQYRSQNPESVPYQNNQLLRNNPHIMNNVNMQNNMRNNNQNNMQNNIQNPNMDRLKQFMEGVKKNNKSGNIIEELLKPQEIDKKNNKEVERNEEILDKMRKEIKYTVTNQPYKNIIKDADYNKKIQNAKDLIIYIMKLEDKNPEELEREFRKLEKMFENMDIEIKLDYAPEKKPEHKKKFDYRHNYVTRLVHEAKQHGDIKEDMIDFYKNKQIEAEKDKEKCDEILRKLNELGENNDNDAINGLN